MPLLDRKELTYFLDLLWVLTQKDLKVRYKNSLLGYLWSLLNPLSLALIFYFVFKIVIKFPVPNYVAFLLSGLFPWQWISNSLLASTTVLLANASLIKKVKCPSYVFPLSIVLQDAFHFLFSIPVIIIFLKIYSIPLSFLHLIYIPFLIINQIILLYGISLLLSSINLFFRDLERLVVIFLTITFYFTPIIYTIDYVPETFRYIFYLNPFFPLIELWHMTLLNSSLNWRYSILGISYSIFFLVIGLYFYKKISFKFAEVL